MLRLETGCPAAMYACALLRSTSLRWPVFLFWQVALVCQLGTSQPQEKHTFQLLKYFVVLEYAGACWAGEMAGGGIVPGTVPWTGGGWYPWY